MKSILTVLGARPQFIKASVVFRAIERSSDLQDIVVHPDEHIEANMAGVLFFGEAGLALTVLGRGAKTLEEEGKD